MIPIFNSRQLLLYTWKMQRCVVKKITWCYSLFFAVQSVSDSVGVKIDTWLNDRLAVTGLSAGCLWGNRSTTFRQMVFFLSAKRLGDPLGTNCRRLVAWSARPQVSLFSAASRLIGNSNFFLIYDFTIPRVYYEHAHVLFHRSGVRCRVWRYLRWIVACDCAAPACCHYPGKPWKAR